MQKINIDETALYELIKRAVRDGLQEEVLRLRLEGLPLVSEKEMQESPHRQSDTRPPKNRLLQDEPDMLSEGIPGVPVLERRRLDRKAGSGPR